MKLLPLALCLAAAIPARAAVVQPEIAARVAPVLQIDGLLFKDLNKNGRLDAYEDWRRPLDERVSDLVAQMTLEEKAGLMVGPTLEMGPGGSVNEQADLSLEPVHRRTARALRSPATSEAHPAPAHPPVHQPLERRPADDGHLAERRAGDRGGDAAGDPRLLRHQPAQPPRRASRSSASTRRRARCRSGRARSASPRRATRRSSRSSRRSPPASTWRSASAARTTRRSTSRPNRAGPASTAPSARTRS